MTEDLDTYFLTELAKLRPAGQRRALDSPLIDGHALTGNEALALFEAQAGSRHVDFAARYLQQRGQGFYTIGSAGHESNAAVAAALRPTDPALLHYRSGAFYVRRACQVDGMDPLRDMLFGLGACVADPISGGRHKVFGHHGLAIIPQTSTIASHLPRALGVAFAIERAARLGVSSAWPRDAITVCGFGDASANHSTAVGAVNTARYCAFQGLPLPLLLVCEDNGLGISVPTPEGWIADLFGGKSGLAYFFADGADPFSVTAAAAAAERYVRTSRAPALLHLRTVRFLAHAGSDAEISYRSATEITADFAHDPLLGTARALVESGACTQTEIFDRYAEIRTEVAEIADRIPEQHRLDSAAAVMAPLAPRNPARVRTAVVESPAGADTEPLTLALAINRTLGELLETKQNTLVFGEDVGRKGGVYGVTRGLQRRFGAARVFDSLLDEQSILGLALGAGVSGLLPIPEIQYLAYLHNAADQLRGEAATLSFFSNGQFRNPLIVRIAAFGYQKGFGGHFHNDNAIAALRDIPGLVIAAPALPDDAAAMLRTCAAAAEVDGTVSCFLEPIALYHTKDLYADGDGEWLAGYPAPHAHVRIGRGRVHGSGGDLTMITFGNGLRMSLRVAQRLAEAGIAVRVLDLRWLAPLPVEDIVRAARLTGRVLVVDETRRTGGVGEAVVSTLVEDGFRGAMKVVAAQDSFIPLGAAANFVFLDEHSIEQAAYSLMTE